MKPRSATPGKSGGHWRRVLPGTLAFLGAMGACGANKVDASDEPGWAIAAKRSASTQYNIVPLSDDRLASGGDINAGGQVAFTELFDLPEPGTYRARFYDGRTVRSISPFGVTAFALALNDRAQVTGTAGDRAFRWSPAQGLVDLAPPGPGNSAGIDINNRGEVAGAAPFLPSLEIPHAARWSARGAIRDLGTLGAPSSLALAINDAGTVAGWAETPSGRRPFRWTESASLQPLGYFGSASAQASDINAAGYIVGAVPFRQDGPDHAFLWTPRHGLFDLGTGGGRSASASRINDRGMVIGQVNNLPAYVRGFAWTRETGLIQIGTGAADSQALDLNNQGQVVGSIEGRAMLWTRGAGSVDLNTRVRNAPHGLLLEQASAINDAGAIVASTNTGLVLLTSRPISNLRPLVGAIQVPDQPRAGVLLSFSASFTDVDARDTHTAVWDWGDATTQAGIVSERYGKGSVSGQHAYGEGEFTIRLTVTDSSGKRTTVRWDLIVPPAPGFSAGR